MVKIKNVILWGFSSKSTSAAIKNLKEQNIINIKMWVGDVPECTHDIIQFHVGNFKTEQYHGCAKNIYDEVFHSTIHQFMDMMSRHSFYKEKSFHDMLNIYNIYFDYFSYFLIQNQDIDFILFSNLPHEGADFILYKIAKKLQIKTILFHQSLFKGRFFYVYDIEDFGTFGQTDTINANLKFKVQNKYENNYMTTKDFRYDVFSLQRNSFGSFFRSALMGILCKKNCLKVANFIERRSINNVYDYKLGYSKQQNRVDKKLIKTTHSSLQLLNDILSSVSNYMGNFEHRYSNYKVAKKKLMHLIDKETYLNQKYIYYPLHLQPELTTSTLGGIYVDQLLAIEKLSTLIPDDWLIYVKENPAQTELMRGNWFFERLRLIKNIKVISPEFNTYSLLEKCIFVATITGTVGWEAISGGKNVLIFGNAWYKSLPGVFSYNEKFNINDILNFKIEHDELERDLNILLQKTADGVIDQDYTILIENYSDEENEVKTAKSIEKLIK